MTDVTWRQCLFSGICYIVPSVSRFPSGSRYSFYFKSTSWHSSAWVIFNNYYRKQNMGHYTKTQAQNPALWKHTFKNKLQWKTRPCVCRSKGYKCRKRGVNLDILSRTLYSRHVYPMSSRVPHVCPISTWNANCAITVLCLFKIYVMSKSS